MVVSVIARPDAHSLSVSFRFLSDGLPISSESHVRLVFATHPVIRAPALINA